LPKKVCKFPFNIRLLVIYVKYNQILGQIVPAVEIRIRIRTIFSLTSFVMYFCIETENIGRLYIFRYITVDDALSLNLLQGSLYLSKKFIDYKIVYSHVFAGVDLRKKLTGPAGQ
jgi:hypothetical protein